MIRTYINLNLISVINTGREMSAVREEEPLWAVLVGGGDGGAGAGVEHGAAGGGRRRGRARGRRPVPVLHGAQRRTGHHGRHRRHG